MSDHPSLHSARDCNCPRDGNMVRVGVRIEPFDPCPVHAPELYAERERLNYGRRDDFDVNAYMEGAGPWAG